MRVSSLFRVEMWRQHPRRLLQQIGCWCGRLLNAAMQSAAEHVEAAEEVSEDDSLEHNEPAVGEGPPRPEQKKFNLEFLKSLFLSKAGGEIKMKIMGIARMIQWLLHDNINQWQTACSCFHHYIEHPFGLWLEDIVLYFAN